MKTVYSKEPRIIGKFDIKCTEMMFVQDMPVAMKGTGVRLPIYLECFQDIVHAACMQGRDDVGQCVYLSAKRMFVAPGVNYNRPGWHIDGYGTDDLNYIWYDSNPTEFCVGQEFTLSEDHALSMQQMEWQAYQENIKIYPCGSLLELDNTIVHRVAEVKYPHMRTFAKVSISRNKYNREGNAHNYLFDYDWEMVPRALNRNDPAAK